MAEIKVSQLPEASGINDADLLMIVQGGVNKKITKENCQFASGDEVSIGTTEPTEDEKLWIKSDETTDQARYKDGNTWKELSIKALDSMPVGTQVEYTGTDIPTGWEQVNDYSTTEINTGKKWIDGKPIYRIVINDDSVPDSTTLVSNVGTIISISGMGDPGTGALRNLPYYEWYNSKKYSCRFEMTSTTLVLDSQLAGASHNAKLRITIEYTKSS